MADTTRYMRVELPADYEKTERVVIYGADNMEIEVSSDLLVTADEIPREGEGYTAEEYRDVLKEIFYMETEVREKVFGVSKFLPGYIKDFSVSELIEKYRAYISMPKTGEYWRREEDGQIVIVRYIKSDTVFYYYCSDGVGSYMSTGNFAKNFTKTEHTSQYLESLFKEMKEVSGTE